MAVKITIDELYRELDQRYGGRQLRLEYDMAAGLYNTLLAWLETDSLLISDCSLETGGQSVRIEGELPSINASINLAKGRISIDAVQEAKDTLSYQALLSVPGEVELSSFLSRPAPFLTSLCEQEESLFSGFLMTNLTLFYGSELSEVEIKGLASLKESDSRWESYAWLLAGSVPAEGALLPYSFDYTELKLRLLLQQAVSLPIGSGRGALVLSTDENRRTEEPQMVSSACMQWEIDVESQARTLTFYTGLFGGNRDVWQYSAVSDPALAIRDITGVLSGLLSLPEQQIFLPPGAFLSSFGLKRLDLVYQRKSGYNTFDGLLPRYTRGIFALNRPLEIFLPNITLERLETVWETSRQEDGSASATLLLAAGAVLELGKLKLYGEVSAYIPQMQFQGSFVLQEEETLQKIAEESGVSLPDFWQEGSNRVSVQMNANAITRRLQILMNVSGMLSLPVTDSLSFRLENLYGFLDYSGGAKQFEISATMAFSCEQGQGQKKFGFSVSACFQEDDWTLSGGLAYGAIDIGALIQAVLKREVTDPSAAGIQLQDFLVTYTVEKRELLLFASCRLWFDILGIRPALGARLRLRLCGEEKEAALAVYLELGIFTALAQVNNIYLKEKTCLFRIGLMGRYLEAVYKQEQSRHSLRISLENITLGDIVLGVLHLINPNARNDLQSPWNVLNRIKLSDFLFLIEWDGKRSRAYFLYQVNRSIAGLIDIEQVGISYEDGQIRYLVTGSCLGQKYTPEEPLSWDAQNGSPADNMAADGQKFHIAYLGIGNHLQLKTEGNSIREMVRSIRRSLTPVSDIPDFSYQKQGGWLVASDFSYQDLFHIWLLLHDPEVYGAAVEIDVSEQSSLAVLNGLFLELYYKKISDETGMFHCRLTLPEQYSEIDLGALRLYLGEILLEIYTNGSFYLDLGFPHNGDFSRSWGMALGIYMGKGGVYFGVLHGDAVHSVPEITNGAFSPVVKIGIGLSVGLSRSFHLGIARGGVSLTAFGMFEGVFAVFQPRDTDAQQGFYYKACAMAGISGTVFLEVDFKIIAIGASAQITAFCELTLESFRCGHLAVDLELSLDAYIKILFFKISFSFHFHQRAEFSFGSDQSTPWQLKNPSDSQGKRGEIGRKIPPICLRPDTVQERITITPVLVPLCSLTEKGDYCIAFPLFISEEDMSGLMSLLFSVLCPEGTEQMGVDWLCALKEALQTDIIDYAFVQKLFAGRIQTHVRMSKETVNEAGSSETGGILFPMLPELTLQVNETVIAYEDKKADENDFQRLAEYFAWLNANPSYEIPKAGNAREQIPICGVILTDWVRLAAEQLTGRMEELFQGLDVECSTLTEAMECYGVSAKALLLGNPDRKLAVTSLPRLVVQTQPGDTLQSLAGRYGLTPEQLWQGAADKGGLFEEDPGITVSGLLGLEETADHVQAEKAAMYAARFSEEEVYYSLYADQLLRDNPHIDLQWECREYGETTVRMPDGEMRQAFAGDTVVRLAKEAAFSGQIRQHTSQKADQMGEHMQSMLQKSIRSLGQNLHRVMDTGTAVSVFRRLYPHFNGRPWEFPLWDRVCLRPAGRIELTDVPIEEGRRKGTAGEFVQRYGLEAMEECVGARQATLDGKQMLHISRPQEIPVPVLRNCLTKEETVRETGAVISRAFLQGTRIFEPRSGQSAGTDTGLKPLFEVLGQQFPLSWPVSDYKLRLNVRPNAAWITVDTELLEIPADLILSWVPAEKAETPGAIERIPDFDYRPKCWTAASGWELAIEGETKQYLGMLPDSMYGYLGRHSCALRLEREGARVEPLWWAGVLNIRLYRKEKGVYAVAGVRGEEAELLYTLLAEKELSGFLFYLPDRLQSGRELLLPAITGICRLIQPKLSTETHSVFSTGRTGTESFLADLTDMSEFLKLLWECTVTGEYLWMYGEQDLVPGEHFDEDGYGELVLVIRFDGTSVCGAAVRGVCLGEEPGGITFYGDEETDKVPLLPPGCVGYTLNRSYGADNRFQMLFQLLGYTAETAYGEKRVCESRSILPSMSGEAQGQMSYQFIFPMWKMYGSGRYGAVGKHSEISLMLRDVLGNQTAYGVCLAEGTYNDLLPGLHELPDTKLTYGFGRAASGTPRILVRCQAVSNEKEGPGRVKEEGWEILPAVLEQLSQDDLQIYSEFTLSECRSSWTDQAKRQLREYVEQLYRWEWGESQEVPSTVFEVDIRIKQGEIVPLEFNLYMQRGGGAAENDPALWVKTAVMPLEPKETFNAEFAQAISDYRLAYDADGRPCAVGAYILENISIAPYTFPLSGSMVRFPEYYALRPLSTSLLTREIQTLDKDGESRTAMFVDADVNQWERQFLSDIERALDGQTLCRASAHCPETVNRLIGCKKKLAEQLARRISPVRKDGTAASAGVRNMAKERFLDNLLWAYETGVICAYRADWKQEGKYRLEPEIRAGKEIRVSKLETEGMDGSGVFCVFLPETADGLEGLDISFPYLEYQIREGIGGYERSDWLQLTEPVTEQIDLISQVPAPFPGKECPLPPQLTAQRNGTDREEFLHYYYEGTVAARVTEQDTLEVKFCYEELSLQEMAEENRIDVLARYQLERDAILEMLGDDEGYQRLTDYAERYTDEKPTHCPEDIRSAGSGGGITLKIGFTLKEKETVLKLLNQSDVDRQLKEMDISLSLPERVRRDEKGWISVSMALHHLPIYPCSRMQIKSHLIRNEGLFGNYGVAVNEEFIFRTEETGLPPLEISADYPTPYVLSGDTWETSVAELFERLEIIKYGLRIHAAVFYEYPAAPHLSGINIRIPVTLLCDIGIPEEITDNLKDWMTGSGESRKEGGRFVFDVRVYKADGRQMPVHAIFYAAVKSSTADLRIL